MSHILTIIFALFSLCAFSQQKDTVVSTKDSLSIVDQSIFVKVEVEARFPGGDTEWNQYVQQNIEKNIRKLVKNKASEGTCEIQFIVDKKGKITNVEALSLKKSLLAKILVDIVKNGPNWIPATIGGKPVKAWRRQKVTFRMPE